MAHEFRQDPVSKEWVLIAPSRAQRPGAPENHRQWEDSYQSKDECPFEHAATVGDGPVLLETDFLFVVPNKYPALRSGVCGEPVPHGPFLIQEANGFHELVITRDHDRKMVDFTPQEIAHILEAYQERYRVIARDDCGDYIVIGHNHRREAGATVWHNHTQIFSSPVIPPKVLRSIQGAERYFQEHGSTIHAMLVEWERAQGTRILFEDERCILFCPFVSRSPHEMRIFPKVPLARFEDASPEDLASCAQALHRAFHALSKVLDDPPFNFYIHTAPAKRMPDISADAYHWHVEIIPKLKIDAGFELATGLFINPIDPDDAAAQLRSAL